MIEQQIDAFAVEHHGANATVQVLPQQYRFQPIAGTLWKDCYILNFFDVDPSPGIRDWDCSQFTYDGHYATDIMIRGFGEQDAGVPLFAVLDGVVVFAHDGENDRNTTLEGQPPNYVILHHGGTHYSWYWHLRKGSVAVTVGQHVKAGAQIAQVGSSGHSEMPHVHFESRFDGYAYETYSGPCHPGPRHWVNQTSIPRHTWISDFAMHNSNSIPAAQFYPHNPPRAGAFVRRDTPQAIGVWYVVHNEPANSLWRARYRRPNGTIGYDSGPRTWNSSTYNRMAARWFSFSFAPDVTGAWTLELTLNGEVLVTAPFLVLNPESLPTNRPPLTPSTIAFDPPSPTTNDAIFCRITAPVPQDADYDLVSYEYQWFINGVSFRRVTNAAFADAIPRGAALPGEAVRCVVTPNDGRQSGAPIEATIPGESRPALHIAALPNDQVVISWPTSMLGSTLQASHRLEPNADWPVAAGVTVRNGNRMLQTNKVSKGVSQFYRLKSP